MSGYPKHPEGSQEPQHEEMDVMSVLKKMQQQLVYLEKKIDTLIAQRPAQDARPPFQRDRPFQKPFRPYGRPNHSSGPRPFSGPTGGDDRGNRSSEGRPERPYRPGGFNKGGHGHSGGGFAPKKPFYKKRER